MKYCNFRKSNLWMMKFKFSRDIFQNMNFKFSEFSKYEIQIFRIVKLWNSNFPEIFIKIWNSNFQNFQNMKFRFSKNIFQNMKFKFSELSNDGIQIFQKHISKYEIQIFRIFKLWNSNFLETYFKVWNSNFHNFQIMNFKFSGNSKLRIQILWKYFTNSNLNIMKALLKEQCRRGTRWRSTQKIV